MVAGPSIDDAIREALSSSGGIEDTVAFAEAGGFAHADVIGACKSLSSNSFIATENLSKSSIRLSEEGKAAISQGSPEALVFAIVPAKGSIAQDALGSSAGAAAKVGLSKAIQNKWLTVSKGEGGKVVSRAVDSIVDTVQQQLQAVEASGGSEDALPADALALLKKRNLLAVCSRRPLPRTLLASLQRAAGRARGSW